MFLIILTAFTISFISAIFATLRKSDQKRKGLNIITKNTQISGEFVVLIDGTLESITFAHNFATISKNYFSPVIIENLALDNLRNVTCNTCVIVLAGGCAPKSLTLYCERYVFILDDHTCITSSYWEERVSNSSQLMAPKSIQKLSDPILLDEFCRKLIRNALEIPVNRIIDKEGSKYKKLYKRSNKRR